MRSSLLMKAIIYLLLGILFTYIAITSAGETIWTPTTILFIFVATLGFLAFFRFLFRYIRQLKNKE